MELIDEQDRSVALLELLHQLFHPLLKIAAVPRARNKGRDIEGINPKSCKRGRHITVEDPLYKRLNDSCFADAGLADQAWIVLGPSAHDT